MGVQCVDQDCFAEFVDWDNRGWGLYPFSEEAAIESVEVVAAGRLVRGADEHRPGCCGGRGVEFFVTGEDAIGCLGFGDVGLVIEESGVLAIEYLNVLA